MGYKESEASSFVIYVAGTIDQVDDRQTQALTGDVIAENEISR